MIPRILENKLKELSLKYPVVTITGPRQSGKSTLVQKVFPDHAYYNLENPETRMRLEEDPKEIFYPEKKKIIIDEIQRNPSLLSYLQVHADQQKNNGQFIITGSQSLLLSNQISQSLAGRTAILKLLPFSLMELDHIKNTLKNDYEDWIYRGFFPRIYDQKISPGDFYPFYFETYIQRDVRLIQNIRDLNQFANFVRLCAGRIGHLLDYSSLANDAGISVNTVRAWISLLEATFVIFLLQPYYKNLNKRIIKSPKLYFSDVGLASFLLNIKNAEQIKTHYMKGNLFENLIIAECFKTKYNRAEMPGLYFFRDSNKNEIDCIIENDSIIYMEIKSSRTFSNSFVQGLNKFARETEIPEKNGLLIYGGDENFLFKKFRVISWRDIVAAYM